LHGKHHTSACSASKGPAKAIVIGAGLGGLASAMRLGAKGYDVTIIDKLDMPGGRGSAFTRMGTVSISAQPL